MTAYPRIWDGDEGLGSPGPSPTRWSSESRADNSPSDRPYDRSEYCLRHHGGVASRFAFGAPAHLLSETVIPLSARRSAGNRRARAPARPPRGPRPPPPGGPGPPPPRKPAPASFTGGGAP